MATITQTYRVRHFRLAIPRKFELAIEKFMPRRCMVVSTGLFLAGLGIPLLMVLEVLPVTFLLGAIGLALTALGGVMALVFCGEI